MHHMFFHPMLSQLFAGEFDAQGGSIPVHAVKAIVIDFSVKNTVFSLRQSENRPLIAPRMYRSLIPAGRPLKDLLRCGGRRPLREHPDKSEFWLSVLLSLTTECGT